MLMFGSRISLFHIVLLGKRSYIILAQKFLTLMVFCREKKTRGAYFQSAAERKVLNQILHPKIKDKTIELIKFYQQKKIFLGIVVAPLLIEAKMTEMVDEIWLVVISEEFNYSV